jgi:ADP-heptose:LPS heptosyltransferase
MSPIRHVADAYVAGRLHGQMSHSKESGRQSSMKLLSNSSLRKTKSILFLLLDGCIGVTRRASKDGGVVLIRTDGIGDFVLWLDAAQAIVNHYQSQGRQVTLVANRLWGEWARSLRVFDDVILIDRDRLNAAWQYRIKTEIALRNRGFSTAVQPIYTRRYFEDNLVRVSGAKETIGWVGDPSVRFPLLRRLRDRWYTRLLDADPAPRMEILRNADFVRQFADPGYLAMMTDLRSLDARRVPESFKSEMPLGEPYYVLFPGTSFDVKRWPEANYAELAQLIFRQKGWRGVVCGGADDREAAASLCSACTAPLLNWSGQTSISQLTAILSGAQFFIGNDTGAAHIAAALGIPTVCLLGGGHYGRFFPYQLEQTDDRPLPLTAVHAMPCFGCEWRCVFSVEPGNSAPCVRQISIDAVWALVRGILSAQATSAGTVPSPH